MNKIPLKTESITPRIDGITKDLKKLRQLAAVSEKDFCNTESDYFDIAKLRLHEALEGVFHIGAHILSRIEGGRTTEYKDIAKKLGEFGIVEKDFANGALTFMAGYRNRLVHFYAEIKSEELYKIIQNNLGDFETFLKAVKNVLEHPEKFGLTIE
ncbi:MAG: DUF86 domain-containing protein [bacterium]|nr:DUF86 domain-containing protein [bacterium]